MTEGRRCGVTNLQTSCSLAPILCREGRFLLRACARLAGDTGRGDGLCLLSVARASLLICQNYYTVLSARLYLTCSQYRRMLHRMRAAPASTPRPKSDMQCHLRAHLRSSSDAGHWHAGSTYLQASMHTNAIPCPASDRTEREHGPWKEKSAQRYG